MKNINRDKTNMHDEGYTYAEDVKALFKKADIPMDKHLIFPCDSDASNFTKVAKEQGRSFHNSSCDGNTGGPPSENTIIITNPPFSKINEFIEHFSRYEVIILIPSNKLTTYTLPRLIMNRLKTIYLTTYKHMQFFNGEDKKLLMCCGIHLNPVEK